ncbi:MAG TPA: J domain-containing protein [Acidimicrobiales bacterium]|nr:J domain-containing protein [Acidimicrobiales bacterium]
MLRRRKKDDPDAKADDNVQISSDEHAWWAAREELDSNKAPSGRTKKKAVDERSERTHAFEEYFSTESLFDWTGAQDGIFDETDPYVVLGLPPSASWEEISAAHRRLAKLHHPDRLVDANDEEREASDRRIRELNVAYMELRRRKGR